MVRSDDLTVTVRNPYIARIELVPEKNAVAFGGTINFTANVFDQNEKPFPFRQAIEFWVNGARNKTEILENGVSRTSIKFDLPFVYQVDARGYNAQEPFMVKSDIETILVI
jgi:hypothetical protein